MFASTLRRPRCGMPTATSCRPACAAEVMSSSSKGMTDSLPSSEKRFCPTYLVWRNASNASAALRRRRMCSCSSAAGALVPTLEARLDPRALVGVLDVHVLDADGARVRVAQHAEDVAQRHQRFATEAARRELAVEVPQGQTVVDEVEVGVATLLVLERVGVGHQVTADAVGVDQLLHARGLVDVVLVGRGDVADPADRLVGDPQCGEDARRRSRPRPAAARGCAAGTHRTARPG